VIARARGKEGFIKERRADKTGWYGRGLGLKGKTKASARCGTAARMNWGG
jgi:hypothetical protein